MLYSKHNAAGFYLNKKSKTNNCLAL